MELKPRSDHSSVTFLFISGHSRARSNTVQLFDRCSAFKGKGTFAKVFDFHSLKGVIDKRSTRRFLRVESGRAGDPSSRLTFLLGSNQSSTTALTNWQKLVADLRKRGTRGGKTSDTVALSLVFGGSHRRPRILIVWRTLSQSMEVVFLKVLRRKPPFTPASGSAAVMILIESQYASSPGATTKNPRPKLCNTPETDSYN